MWDGNFWGFRESPFTDRAAESWFYESPGHAEALARLFFLVEERQPGGVLVGPEGIGKSLLMKLLSQQASRSRRQCVRLDLEGLDDASAAWALAGELRLAPRAQAGVSAWWRAIDDHFLGAGFSRLPIVVLLDHLDRADTSCSRFVERLVASSRKSRGHSSVIAAARTLKDGELLRPLQRMTVLRIELPALQPEETADYVAFALRQAGSSRPVFTAAACRVIHEATRGIPRQVNQLCQVALLAALNDERRQIEPDIVQRAAAELALIA